MPKSNTPASLIPNDGKFHSLIMSGGNAYVDGKQVIMSPMTTTQESVEKDEELGKLIKEKVDFWFPRCPETAEERYAQEFREVAAFSAKRAREKAIEECVAAIEKAKPLVGPSGESKGQVNSFHKKLSGLNLAIAQLKSL